MSIEEDLKKILDFCEELSRKVENLEKTINLHFQKIGEVTPIIVSEPDAKVPDMSSGKPFLSYDMPKPGYINFDNKIGKISKGKENEYVLEIRLGDVEFADICNMCRDKPNIE